MNFFDIVESHLSTLTKNEQALFDYVVSNMDKMLVKLTYQRQRSYVSSRKLGLWGLANSPR